jgi:hypothetical protein
MRKILSVIAVICIIASCSKPTTSNVAGTWTFHSTTYSASQAYYILGSLAAYTGTNVPTGSLALWFRNVGDSNVTSWPAQPGSYTLTTSYPPGPGYAFLQLTDSSMFNSYTITGSSTPQIVVDTISKGFMKVSIPAVMLVNTNGTPPFYPQIIGKPTGTDSSMVSGTIVQTR